MRFDTPVYFQRVLPGAYNADNGNYGEEIVEESKVFAAISSPGIDMLKLVYGELKQGCLTIRLQRPYNKEFDRIRVGDKLYRVDNKKPLNNKCAYIVSEVQGSFDGEIADGTVEYQKGYNDGYEVGKKESYGIGFAEGEAEGFEKGKAEGYEDGYAKGEMLIYNIATMQNLYSGAVFPENTELVLKVKNVCSITSAFYGVTGLKSVKLIADNIPETAIIAVTGAFNACADIETIDLTEFGRKISSANHFVYNANKLKSILGALDMSASPLFSQTFGSSSLEEVEFVPNTIKISIAFNRCGNLSDKSIQSIIDGLADLTGQTGQTVDFDSPVISKLTDAQWAQIYNKNWSAI